MTELDGGSGTPPVPPAGIDVIDDPELLSSGWVRRNVADSDRLDELIELYETLGLEVVSRPLKRADFQERCHGCAARACRAYRVIYTRDGAKPSRKNADI